MIVAFVVPLCPRPSLPDAVAVSRQLGRVLDPCSGAGRQLDAERFVLAGRDGEAHRAERDGDRLVLAPVGGERVGGGDHLSPANALNGDRSAGASHAGAAEAEPAGGRQQSKAQAATAIVHMAALNIMFPHLIWRLFQQWVL